MVAYLSELSIKLRHGIYPAVYESCLQLVDQSLFWRVMDRSGLTRPWVQAIVADQLNWDVMLEW